MAAVSGESIFFTSNDGLRLHACYYGARATTATPVVCLPGLTRTAADFEVLAERLSAAGRRVIALDYRGRGLSAYDPNPANYNVRIELGDVLTVLDALTVPSAVFIGTSRGGILTMLLATVRPQAIAAAILNDIGPVIDLPGLLRIQSYVGRLPAPQDFADGARILRGLFAAQFPTLSDEDWLASARRAFKEDDGRLVPTYDVKIADTLKDIGLETGVPDLWQQFDALAQVPVMVIRGARSDLLSAETVEAMKARHHDLRVVEVADQGHAPMLQDEPTLAAIEQFVAVVPAFRDSWIASSLRSSQ